MRTRVNRRSVWVFAAVISLALPMMSRTAAAQEKKADNPPAARSDFALTIYSSADPASFDPKQFAVEREANPAQFKVPGYGVVRETRKVTLAEAENTVRFTDVAAGIDPTTVAFKSLTAPASTSVLEQDYEFDLVGADKILEKYLGQTITVRQKNQPPIDDATLLSAEPGMLVVRDHASRGQGLRLIPRQQDLVEIDLPRLPAGLITKPTLVWKIATTKPGDHEVQVSYQTDGMTWRADYNLVANKDDTKSDVSAWVSILNQSGASYPDTRLKLVAGDVQRIAPQIPREYAFVAAAPAPAPAPQFEEKAFFEYHLYTLGRKTSLADRSTKQIELFPPKSGVSVSKAYVYYGYAGPRGWVSPTPNVDRNLGIEGNKKVDIYLLVKNSEANGLGIPLPAGRVRVYKKDDADAALEFIGEDAIEHTAKDEALRVKLGSAFDVVGERKQMNFLADTRARVITESFEITLRNHKTEPVRVIVKENFYRWSSWTITQKSDEFQKEDSRTIHFTVDVRPNGERKITYTVRYTW